MAYRTQAEKENDAEPEEVDGLRCTRCGIVVPRAADPRCPQCLRRSTVVDPKGLGDTEKVKARSRGGEDAALDRPTPTVWPYTDRCPICGERPVDDAVVFLRIVKVASSIGRRDTAGLFVRVRSCGACRARIGRLNAFRLAMLVPLLAGLPLCPMFFTGGVTGLSLGLLGVVLVVASLVTVTHGNRSARALLDASGLSVKLSERVPAPSGLIEYELRVLQPTLPRGRKAVDLLDALRDGRSDDG